MSIQIRTKEELYILLLRNCFHERECIMMLTNNTQWILTQSRISYVHVRVYNIIFKHTLMAMHVQVT